MQLQREFSRLARFAAALGIAIATLGGPGGVSAAEETGLPSRDEIARPIEARLESISGWRMRWTQAHTLAVRGPDKGRTLESQLEILVYGESSRAEADGEIWSDRDRQVGPQRTITVSHLGAARVLDSIHGLGWVLEADGNRGFEGHGATIARLVFSSDFLDAPGRAPLRRETFEGVSCVVVGDPSTPRSRPVELFLDPARAYLPLAERQYWIGADGSKHLTETSIEYSPDEKGRELPRKVKTQGFARAGGAPPRPMETAIPEIEILDEAPDASSFSLTFPKGTRSFPLDGRGAVVLTEAAADFSAAVPSPLLPR